MHTLHIRLLGDFRLVYADEVLTSVNSPRLQALLVYLLLHRQAPQSRQHIAFRFWPDSSEKQAHTNLRKLLFQLRNALPDPDRFLAQDHLTVQWRPDAPYRLDVAELTQWLARCRNTNGKSVATQVDELTRVADLYQGELLPSSLDEWLLPVRQQLLREVMGALEQLISLSEHQREYQAGIRYAQRLLGLDPLHETGYRRLMQLHASNGDRAAALHHYHTCVTILQRELGVDPDEETRTLYEQLLKQDHPRAGAPATVTPSATPLVGRQTEWAVLVAAWRRAQRGEAHFVALAGETGMGKSRLAEELANWVRAQGGGVAQSRSYEAEGGLAYAPVTEWLRSHALKALLKKLDNVWLSEVTRLLPELLIEHANLTPPTPLSEAWQRQRFFEALAQAFLIGKTPLLLVIDDLQWCDSETLTWLRFLLRFDAQARLLIIGTWRSEAVDDGHPLQTWLRDLRNASQLTSLELTPLNLQETQALAQQVTAHPLTTAEIEQLYTVTEGHPLFVVETLRTRSDPHPSLLVPHSQSLPPKIQNVIQSRLAQLSIEARDLAGIAATIGRQFSLAVITYASQSQEEPLVRALDELWQRRIIRELGTGDYDFSHDRIREVAYQELSQARRRFFHRRVAEALEAVGVTQLDEISAQLAVQYEQAEVIDKAARYWRRAGERAIAQFAQQDAIRYLSRALDLTPVQNQEQRCDLLLARVKLFEHQGMIAKAQSDLGALQFSVATLDTTATNLRRRAEAALCAAIFLTARNEHERARAEAQIGVDLAEACKADDLAAHGQFMLGMADCGDYATYPTARLHFEKALSMARASGLYAIEAKSLDMLGAAGVYMGAQVNEIAAYFQQTLAIYQQHGDLPGEIATLGRFGFLASMQREGNYDQIILDCYRALRLGSEIAGWESEATILSCLGYLLYLQGDYAGARPYKERAVLIIRQGQRPHSIACEFLDLGPMALDQGDYDKGRTYLEDALHIYRSERRQEQHISQVLGFLALCHHYLGEHTEATRCGEEAVHLARTLNAPRIEGEALTRCGRILVSQERFDEATALFQQALIDFHQTEQQNHRTMPLAGLAEIALRQGNSAQAQAWVEGVLAHLQTHELDRTDEELYVYMTCYRVLDALHDQRSANLLRMAHEQLQVRATSLETDRERAMFWSVPPHAEVLAEVQQRMMYE